MFMFRYNDYASSRAKGLGDYNVDRKPLASEDEVQHDSEKFRQKKLNSRMCLQCFGVAKPLETKYCLYFMNIS